MRFLIIFLVVLNIAYFIWSSTLGNTTYTPPPLTKEGIPSIHLLASNKNDVYKSKNSILQSSCYTFGPFNSERTAQTVAKKINDFGLATDITSQQTMQTLNYLVYLPALPSRQEAEAVVKNISKHKIKNTLIIETGPYKNAVALGSFDNLDKARRHAEYVIFLGYDARYTEQKVKKEVYWINYDEPFSSNAPVLKWAKDVDPKASVQKVPKACDF